MKKIALLVLVVYQFLVPADAVVYYVDSINGNDINSGNSPNNAWKSLRKVSALVHSPGDKILLKRGSTWFETLELKGSGKYNDPILISDYGEGDLPVIDGGLRREQCMILKNRSYVTVSNIQMQNATRQGAVRILRCDNILIEDCIFYVTGHGGVFIESSNNCIIRNNRITTASGNHRNQTDGIYSQRNDNILIDFNHIVINNENPDMHCDGIQSYKDKNLTIRNNYVEQRNTKRNHAQGIYATTMTGTHIYYNNVVYCPNTKSSVMGFRNLDEGRGFLKAYHNTLVGGGGNILYVSENAGLDAKNNIFYTTNRAPAVRFETNEVFLDNNLYFHTGDGNVAILKKGEKGRKISDMKKEGRERNGITGDPMFTEDFQLLPNSPCIDNGLRLGPPYDVDRLGVKRKTPDIGAYEYSR